MRSILEKLIVAETKIELLERFIKDLEDLPDNISDKYRRKLTNYRQVLKVEQNKLDSVLNCIQKEYPHACKCK